MLVVALDGVPFTYVQRLFEAGELPNLRAIAERGPMAQMDTSVPNVSSVAWASFMTGMNPGKHNIYGFLDRHPGTKKTTSPPLATFAPRPSSTASARRGGASSP